MAILAGDPPPSESVKVRHFPLASENLTITWKLCKSYMSFPLVLKSVTLNDLERHNGYHFVLFQRIW